jgi:Adenosine deaminase
MTMSRRATLVVTWLTLFGCAAGGASTTPPRGTAAASNEARAAAWLEANRNRPPLLRMFLQEMPKGGDIHTHLSGAVYAESYLEWAADLGLCVDLATSTIVPPPCQPESGRPSVRETLGNADTYSALVDGLSTRNLANQLQSGHNQFFGTFARFGAVSGVRLPEMVAELVSRAADQHVSYVEMMLTVRGAEIRRLAREVRFDGDLAATWQRLRDPATGLAALVQAGVADLGALERSVDSRLGCAGAPPPAPCRVTRRYLQASSRVLEPGEVFGELVYAFELAQAEPRVVGINLLAPEDDLVARRDYRLHMRMVGWLAARYPGVKIALHAGELRLGLVPPEDLRFHIREAVEIGTARRIGHGVDIAYERDAMQLLAMLKERDVLVEICLTSNDVILGVRGRGHPLSTYLRAGVPVTLATDDEGVSRIDLTHEYVRAAREHGLGYRDLKRLARRSLTYSFVSGPSLWREGATSDVVAPCAGVPPGGDPSLPCRAFLDSSEKARLQWDLERAFTEFEAQPWLR